MLAAMKSRAPIVAGSLAIAAAAVARFVFWVFSDRKRTLAAVVLIGIVRVALISAHPASADGYQACNPGAPGLIDQTSSDLDRLTTTWPSTMIGAGAPIFWTLLTFMVILAVAFEMPGTHGHPPAVMVVLLKNTLIPTMVAALYMNTPTLGPALVNGFLGTAANVSTGSGAFTPSFSTIQEVNPGDAFQKFDCLTHKMLSAKDDSKFVGDLFTNPGATIENALINLGASIIVEATGALIMVEEFLWKLETVFVMGIGAILMVGIAASTLYSFPLRYLGALVGLGLKGIGLSFLIGLILAEGNRFTALWGGSAIVGPHETLRIAMILIALGIVSWFLPNMLATLGGAPAMGMGTAFAAGMSMMMAFNSGTGIMSRMSGRGGGGGGGGKGKGAADHDDGREDGGAGGSSGGKSSRGDGGSNGSAHAGGDSPAPSGDMPIPSEPVPIELVP